ncbi:transmembrane protein 97 [Striga asiatica]|uniref:Transmembrane protein 97 n=1 Tax=Striga asiatica TaxID=4170 RepID=A0A5A7R620_STRAF|nr:transmembrane protein 97 [Striga asiatica]
MADDRVPPGTPLSAISVAAQDWHAQGYGVYLVTEKPHLFRGIWPLNVACLYGISAEKSWLGTAYLSYGPSPLIFMQQPPPPKKYSAPPDFRHHFTPPLCFSSSGTRRSERFPSRYQLRTIPLSRSSRFRCAEKILYLQLLTIDLKLLTWQILAPIPMEANFSSVLSRMVLSSGLADKIIWKRELLD